MKYAKIDYVKRVNSSVNGNPNYEIGLYESDLAQAALTGLKHGEHDVEYVVRRTKSDISDSYGIIPNECREGKVMAYELTKAGRIARVEKVVG